MSLVSTQPFPMVVLSARLKLSVKTVVADAVIGSPPNIANAATPDSDPALQSAAKSPTPARDTIRDTAMFWSAFRQTNGGSEILLNRFLGKKPLPLPLRPLAPAAERAEEARHRRIGGRRAGQAGQDVESAVHEHRERVLGKPSRTGQLVGASRHGGPLPPDPA